MVERSKRKVVLGKVVSNQSDKTITVLVERRIRHPVYGKYVTKSSKFMVHDQDNVCSIGDVVRIMETRPLSKCKHWRLMEIIKKAQ